MNSEERQLQAAIECIQASLSLIAEGKVESVIRHSFSSYLRQIFPEIPSWLERHIEGGEAAVRFAKEGQTRTGFVDNLVDLTAIEYESDLTNRAKFETGLGQVIDYCASLLNQGNDPELILGILSDTVRWRAYRIRSLRRPVSGELGRDHIELEEIERIDLGAADQVSAKTLVSFLHRYLGRLGSRPLNAASIAKDLGFESQLCSIHINALRTTIAAAIGCRPEYAELIANLWDRFVNYVRDREATAAFDQHEYADELYIVTLAKLVIANVIERRALLSDDAELRSVLQGEFFRNRGLLNLVEYDYFGWLNEGSSLEELLPVGRALQDDLRAYDFSRIPSEDIFGRIMSQLAKRSQRLLLGQECTPNWLAHLIVTNVISKLPEGEAPQLVDMSCGSGALIVEAVKVSKARIESSMAEESQTTKLQMVTQAITGFDIDPLAVLLSKVSWVLAARDWLEPFGAFPLTIPVYHADSLFAITPLSEVIEDEQGQEFHTLRIADTGILLPRFLVSPEFQPAFDFMLDFAYAVALSSGESELNLESSLVDQAINEALGKSSAAVDSDQRSVARDFLSDLTLAVNRLNREKRNGVWVFILRNSYRPGLVAGQFNGLVSNPPWLALSKIADNPYQEVLKRKADQFGIRPEGPSFLHVELSTIFLLHAVDRYLKMGAAVGCITPDSVLNGYHHNPFRTGGYRVASKPVTFALDEIWHVQKHTFKNEAIVLFGRKVDQSSAEPNPIPGAHASETGLAFTTFYRNVQGRRTAWSEQDLSGKQGGFFVPANFRQGADIMPRTLFFHEVVRAPAGGSESQWQIKPIDLGSSPFAFAIKDAKKHQGFRLPPCILPDSVIFDVLTSNLLTPFDLSDPLRAVLPIKKCTDGSWAPLDEAALAAKGAAVVSAFKQITQALGNKATIRTVWDLINMRSKLEQQIIRGGGYLVFTGTSGGIVCSAHVMTDSFNITKLIVDQTLNWTRVRTEEEAVYLSGLLNSEAINEVIQDFQPEGAFGKRHIHSLPFGVTPPYNPLDQLHQSVVGRTQQLLQEYRQLRVSEGEIQMSLDPNRGSLARRRLIIKSKLSKLPSYQEYDETCRILYGV